MFSNISFIGGIHGVGKSTICKNICSTLDIQYLSASEVLKWGEINQDKKNKKVKNVDLTQDRLIRGLIQKVDPNFYYLLDGHYCLLNESNQIIKIPFETFEAINPVLFHLIIDDVSQIKLRLESRDRRNYDYQLLDDMQKSEIDYANELSKKLNIPLSIGKEKNFSDIIIEIQKLNKK